MYSAPIQALLYHDTDCCPERIKNKATGGGLIFLQNIILRYWGLNNVGDLLVSFSIGEIHYD